MPGNPRAMCYCHTCKREISSMGIATHRMGHKNRKERCVIEYSGGDVLEFDFTEKK